jgi:hypothetical protein
MNTETINRMYKTFISHKNETEQLTEDTSATGGPSAGGAVHGGGTAYANATTAGMGAIVAPQGSSLPGALTGTAWSDGGGTEGSGDIAVPYNATSGKRMMQKFKAPGKDHSSRGKRSRRKTGPDMNDLKKLVKTVKSKKPAGKVMSFDSFTKKDMEKVTKVDQ